MSLPEELSVFEQELRARLLLHKAREVCGEFGLRPDDLKRKPRVVWSTPIIVEARARFARYLCDDLGWSTRMAAKLLGYKTGNMIHYMLGRGGEKRRLAAEKRAKKFADKGKSKEQP